VDEPRTLYSVVRDCDGELWMRGRKWWYWQRTAPSTAAGKLMWHDLDRQYGPLTTDAETERIEAKGILGGRARD